MIYWVVSQGRYFLLLQQLLPCRLKQKHEVSSYLNRFETLRCNLLHTLKELPHLKSREALSPLKATSVGATYLSTK